MKRSPLIALYHGTPAAGPSAATDANILAAARARRTSRLPGMLALAAAFAMVSILVARWMLPGHLPAPDGSSANFGIAEGQARAWLIQYQPPLTATGPGSQEGLP